MTKNPQHTIPFLEENGFYLSESRAILHYLVDTRSPESGLLGRFPKRRAIIHQRLQFDAGTFSPRLIAAFRPLFRGSATTISEETLAQIRDALQIIDSYLSKSAYIAGDSVTIADFTYLAWFPIFVVSIFVNQSIF